MRLENVINKRNDFIIVVLILLLIFIACISMTLGRYEIHISQVFQLLMQKISGEKMLYDPFVEKILIEVRFPRVCAAILIGGALSVSGAVFQGLFKNPMVSADILGVTSGAGFGAALGLLWGLAYWKVELMAFVFGIIAVSATYLLSLVVGKKEQNILMLILSGIVIGTLFKSFISCVTYLADPDDALQRITFWLMGSLTRVKESDLLMLAIPIILGTIPLVFVGWKMNAMAFSEEEAMALGIHTEKLKLLVIVCSTIITSTAVAMGGIIGWIGLVIPHLVRLALGPDNHLLIPASLLSGAIYLLLIDNISRTLLGIEMPISILTSIIGSPFFIYLLFRSRRDA